MSGQEPRTETGKALVAPPCTCGIAQVYGQAPWGVEHASKCESRRGIPLNAILNIEAEARQQGAAEERALADRLAAALDHDWRSLHGEFDAGASDDCMEAYCVGRRDLMGRLPRVPCRLVPGGAGGHPVTRLFALLLVAACALLARGRVG